MFLPFQGILFRFHVSFLWCSNANHFFKPKNMQKITLTLEITTWDDVEEVGKTKKRKTGEGCFDGHKNPLKIKKKFGNKMGTYMFNMMNKNWEHYNNIRLKTVFVWKPSKMLTKKKPLFNCWMFHPVSHGNLPGDRSRALLWRCF